MSEEQRTWRDHVEMWRASGKTQAAYAASVGLKTTTLVYWLKRARLESKAETNSSTPPPTVRMARVKPSRVSESLAVCVGAARIEVRQGFDPALLRDILNALGATR
jgi:hypothetical protein